MDIRYEPVRNTCPKIDIQIKTIRDILSHMDSVMNICCEECEGNNEEIYNWYKDLEGVIDGFEELRSANSALRDWGGDMVIAVEERDCDIQRLENQISDLEDQISDKDDVIQELNCDLDYARAHGLNQYEI